jgi:hypothetical protein
MELFQQSVFAPQRLCFAEMQACVSPLELALKRSNCMLQADAYVHQYEQFGLDRSELYAAIHTIQDVVESYASM